MYSKGNSWCILRRNTKLKIQLIAIDKKGKPGIRETNSHYLTLFIRFLCQGVTKMAKRRSVRQQSRVTQDKVTIHFASILIVDSRSESDE